MTGVEERGRVCERATRGAHNSGTVTGDPDGDQLTLAELLCPPTDPDQDYRRRALNTDARQARCIAEACPPDLWEPGSLGRQVWNDATNGYETYLADPETGELELDSEGRPLRRAR